MPPKQPATARKIGRPKGSKSLLPKLPPQKPPIVKRGVTLQDRRALGALAQGASVAQAAATANMSPASLRNKLSRGALRQKFLDILQAAGLTDQFIAAKFKALMDASTVRWNPETKGWDVFTDNTTQLGAVKAVAEIKGHYPERGEKPPVAVQIISPLAAALEQTEQALAQGALEVLVEVPPDDAEDA
jgi:hypothetical protein